MRDERGQALVELVACLPVVALVALALAQGMLVLGAASAAESAVERARVAAALGDDPVAAARRGLAGARRWLDGRTSASRCRCRGCSRRSRSAPATASAL